MTAPKDLVANPAIYGRVNPRVLAYKSIVEITVDNHDSRAHPFHLHGHNFQVISRGEGGDLWPGLDTAPPAPMRRDSIVVYSGSSVTIRFVADNPGVNLFHCHSEWHVESGLTATLIEAPDVLQASKIVLPASHKDVCSRLKIPQQGNAAGRTDNFLNLAGANVASPDPSKYWG